jgi:hypothetical protein
MQGREGREDSWKDRWEKKRLAGGLRNDQVCSLSLSLLSLSLSLARSLALSCSLSRSLALSCSLSPSLALLLLLLLSLSHSLSLLPSVSKVVVAASVRVQSTCGIASGALGALLGACPSDARVWAGQEEQALPDGA